MDIFQARIERPRRLKIPQFHKNELLVSCMNCTSRFPSSGKNKFDKTYLTLPGALVFRHQRSDVIVHSLVNTLNISMSRLYDHRMVIVAIVMEMGNILVN